MAMPMKSGGDFEFVVSVDIAGNFNCGAVRVSVSRGNFVFSRIGADISLTDSLVNGDMSAVNNELDRYLINELSSTFQKAMENFFSNERNGIEDDDEKSRT